ncbi:MAG: rRNA maturation RNase YbeY [Geobacteraceae bacterium GWC2_55_20]|nr:MAG: rRNA maturation RNase YbeY [Geobacteraceae bacterium GWC2_55_20]OGU20536.1 MAG: rRNA maturation RNase YbeY [Geobacteraceae bacterium GWF2_54_21]HBA73234.1 rRNA maturation RNase YbeY [Geobacter sp.]HCE68930.1 rRNA maturation RNase YbeY [Geobacter sp.]
MPILMNNRQRRHRFENRRLKKVAERILSALECPEGTELSISIVGDRSIRIINRDYLDKDRPTNVISFSLQEGDCSGVNPLTLGDVVISADTAAREADEGGIVFFERLSFLLLHGILHLCGYDHERSGDAEAQKMQRKEQQLFRILKKEGLLNPTGS